MSKIICDVCGSAYSDTASQCPICGTAKRDNAPIAEQGKETVTADSGYTYVKGGRFSHSNVRKHNSGKELRRKPAEKSDTASSMPPLIPAQEKKTAAPKQEKPAAPKNDVKAAPVKTERKPEPRKEKDPDRAEKRTNLILMIVVLILLLAVIFVGVYIARNFKIFFPSWNQPPETQGSSQATVGNTRRPCIGITLPALENVESDGEPIKLEFQFTPSNTTDEKIFISSNEEIAMVDSEGNLRVVNSGEVTITVTCGDQTAELVLNCIYNDPAVPTEPKPTEPPTPPVPDAKLELVSKDLTFSEYGTEYKLYRGDIDTSLITFTSSDDKIVTVDATGRIKIVGKGTATITATYGDQTVECIIRCTKVTVPTDSPYKLNHTDVTLKVGEKITIQLINKETNAPVTGLTWYASMENYADYISMEPQATGVRVSGVSVTVGVKGVAYVRVMCDYEGTTYTCIVRVKPKD